MSINSFPAEALGSGKGPVRHHIVAIRIWQAACVFFLTLAFSGSANAGDHIQLYTGGNETGQSVKYHLPAPGDTYFPQWNYWVGSVRRTGAQLLAENNGVLNNTISSLRVVANDTDVSIYIFDGSDFDGKLVHWRIPKGHSGVMGFMGWLNNKANSFIVIREKSPTDFLGQLTDTEISLETLPGVLRQEFVDQFESSNEIDDVDAGKTQVSYTTSHKLWKDFGWNPPSAARYWDMLRIHQDMTIDPNGWLWDYDTSITLGFWPGTTGGHLNFKPAVWKVWVEGGAISGRVKDGLAAAVAGSMPSLGNQLRGGIEDELRKVTAEYGDAVFDLVWDNVSRVGWKTCDNFNNLSGYAQPAQPFCWANGSNLKMFPPTLVLHHDPATP